MKRAILILVTATLSSGCDQLEIKDEGYAEVDHQVRTRSAELSENIKTTVTGADPEKYTVQFSWPLIEKDKRFRIRLGTKLTEVKSNQTFFTHTVDHNQTLNYTFDVLDSAQNLERSFRVSVVVPFDFVVREGNSNLIDNQKISANRLFLSERFPLTIGNSTVDILVNEIHANRGIIQTYSTPLPTSDPEFFGKSGGNLSISAKKLFGRLKVYMRGGKGGIGKKGLPTGGRAATGTPAGHGSIQCIPNCDSVTCFTPRPFEEIFRRGGMTCSCKELGRPGSQGAKGKKGKTGFQGMPGGDTGNVRINIIEYVPLDGIDPDLPNERQKSVEVFQIPGPGGDGGAGGDGQLGGLGGPRIDHQCTGPQGAEGPIGDQGDEGNLGKPGNLGMMCLTVSSEDINECFQ